MSIVVSNIAEVSLNKIALWIHVGVDDWTAERANIASNECNGQGFTLFSKLLC